VLPFGRLWYDKPDHAIGYAMHYSRSADAVIRVYDGAGNVIETHHVQNIPLLLIVPLQQRWRLVPSSRVSQRKVSSIVADV